MAIKFKTKKEIFEATLDKCVKNITNVDFDAVSKKTGVLGSDLAELATLSSALKAKATKAKVSDLEYQNILSEIDYEYNKSKSVNAGHSVTMAELMASLVSKLEVVINEKREAAKKLLAELTDDSEDSLEEKTEA